MGEEHVFHAKIGEDTYLISTFTDGPNEDGRSLLPGKATTNSYLIVGEDKALLFDLAVNEAGVYEYAEKLAQKEVMLVLSHGHFDHVYHLNQREEVWIHKGDEFLLHEGMPFVGAPPVVPCPRIHYLMDGDQIELGNRVLKVIHIPGHTPGSILLLDEKTKILFSGDTGARRLLLGVSEDVDEEELCKRLEALIQEDFKVMYSAHDRCALPKEHIELMTSVMRREIDVDVENGIVPNVGDIITLNFGRENQLKYFNVASVKRRKE